MFNYVRELKARKLARMTRVEQRRWEKQQVKRVRREIIERAQIIQRVARQPQWERYLQLLRFQRAMLIKKLLDTPIKDPEAEGLRGQIGVFTEILNMQKSFYEAEKQVRAEMKEEEEEEK